MERHRVVDRDRRGWGRVREENDVGKLSLAQVSPGRRARGQSWSTSSVLLCWPVKCLRRQHYILSRSGHCDISVPRTTGQPERLIVECVPRLANARGHAPVGRETRWLRGRFALGEVAGGLRSLAPPWWNRSPLPEPSSAGARQLRSEALVGRSQQVTRSISSHRSMQPSQPLGIAEARSRQRPQRHAPSCPARVLLRIRPPRRILHVSCSASLSSLVVVWLFPSCRSLLRRGHLPSFRTYHGTRLSYFISPCGEPLTTRV